MFRNRFDDLIMVSIQPVKKIKIWVPNFKALGIGYPTVENFVREIRLFPLEIFKSLLAIELGCHVH